MDGQHYCRIEHRGNAANGGQSPEKHGASLLL
jgi:hypothetical protein